MSLTHTSMSQALTVEHAQEQRAPRQGLWRQVATAAPHLWRDAVHLERMGLKRAHRVMARTRKATRRYIRKIFR